MGEDVWHRGHPENLGTYGVLWHDTDSKAGFGRYQGNGYWAVRGGNAEHPPWRWCYVLLPEPPEPPEPERSLETVTMFLICYEHVMMEIEREIDSAAQNVNTNVVVALQHIAQDLREAGRGDG